MPELVHYIWAGPPAKGKHAGQDTIGPDLLREVSPSQPIHFYCFSEAIPHYKEHFAGKDIKVHSIEDYVRDKDPKFSILLSNLKERALEHEDMRDTYREYVTIKGAFQLFLQIDESGYFMDTNIIPDYEFEGERLPAHAKFSASFLIEANGSKPSFDPWLMYSPCGDTEAKPRFDRYCKPITWIYEKYAPKGLGKKPSPHDEISTMLEGASFRESAAEAEKLDARIGREVYSSAHVVGMTKRYYNTHRKDTATYQYPVLQRALLDKGGTKEFQYLFDTQEQGVLAVYETYDRKRGETVKTTLVHEAIEHEKLEILDYLLSKSQDPWLALTEPEPSSQGSPLAHSLTSSKKSDCFERIMAYHLKSLETNEVDFLNTMNRICQIIKTYSPTSELKGNGSLSALWENLRGTFEKDYLAVFNLTIQNLPLEPDNLPELVSELKSLCEVEKPQESILKKQRVGEGDSGAAVSQGSARDSFFSPKERQHPFDEEAVLSELYKCLPSSGSELS